MKICVTLVQDLVKNVHQAVHCLVYENHHMVRFHEDAYLQNNLSLFSPYIEHHWGQKNKSMVEIRSPVLLSISLEYWKIFFSLQGVPKMVLILTFFSSVSEICHFLPSILSVTTIKTTTKTTTITATATTTLLGGNTIEINLVLLCKREWLARCWIL